MGLTDELYDNDAELFVFTDGFGEQVTYTDADGNSSTINAVIVRSPTDNMPGAAVGRSPNIEAYIRNDATYGVTSIENGDYITVTERIGDGSTKDYRVAEVLSHDAGMWRVQLR